MYQATAFDDVLAEGTATAWEEQMAAFDQDEDQLLVSSYRGRLRVALGHRNGIGDGFFYGLVSEAGGYAQAIIEVAHRRGAAPQLRLLNITLEPKLDLENRDGTEVESLQDAIKLLVRSITEALRLTFSEHPSDELKIYARTDRMQAFLEVVAAELSQGTATIPGLTVSIQGRWLVFTKA